MLLSAPIASLRSSPTFVACTIARISPFPKVIGTNRGRSKHFGRLFGGKEEDAQSTYRSSQTLIYSLIAQSRRPADPLYLVIKACVCSCLCGGKQQWPMLGNKGLRMQLLMWWQATVATTTKRRKAILTQPLLRGQRN